MTKKIDSVFPVTFNPVKHHKNYIRQILQKLPLFLVIEELQTVGDNVIDIYTGDYSVSDIERLITEKLKNEKVLAKESYLNWLAANKNYRFILLPDQSKWLLREGIDPNRYIHIHPAKFGAFHSRFKGTTLKTVCILKRIAPVGQNPMEIVLINQARRLINLSPIKNSNRFVVLERCWNELFV